jgi:hypothetical protein
MITAWQSGKPFTIVNTGAGADNPVESDGKQHGFNNRVTPQNGGGRDRPDQIADAPSPKGQFLALFQANNLKKYQSPASYSGFETHRQKTNGNKTGVGSFTDMCACRSSIH